MSLAVTILAAGKGTRMRSSQPKVLHRLAGRPMVDHVVAAARLLSPQHISIVYGHGGTAVQQALPDADIHWAEQAEQLGTGHAVAQAMPLISQDKVLILYGDVPLIQADTLAQCLAQVDAQSICLITLDMAKPQGYGRIVRDTNGAIERIVEQKDASVDELAITEVNTGILACPREFLAATLPQLSSNNAQGEYYLTDVIALAVAQGLNVTNVQPANGWEVDGVNDRVQLARLERIYQRQQAEALMRDGASLADPARLDIRGKVSVGQDVSIDVNAVFEGDVSLGDRVVIGPNCVIRNATIGAGSHIKANSIIDGASVAEHCEIGPFGRLRPGARLACGAKIGNFVEIKKSLVGAGSKVNHLSYIGDAVIGTEVNIGAGTITCNYDGVNKFTTEIADDCFIGSNTCLVAPVKLERGVTTGAGSVITKDIGAAQLAVARAKQRNIDGWQRPAETAKKEGKS